MKIVVTAGHNRSLGTIALLNELAEHNHEIADVIVVKTFQAKRFYAYLKQFGIKTIAAKFVSHYLQKEGTYLSAETAPIRNYIKSKNLAESSVSEYCKTRSISFSSTPSLASSSIVQRCLKIKPDLIIYSGGGILTNEFIDTATNGVLNAHSGPLPQIRGMNAIEWSLIKGLQPTTTVHLIDSGIDTGKILHSETIPTKLGDSIYDLRGKAIQHNIELLTKVINSFEMFNQQAVEQNLWEGRQYYVMHKFMKACLPKN